MSATPVNPLALGIGAGASFAGGILGAIGSGPSKQMQALNSQIQDFSQGMTSLAKQEGIDAGTVFNQLMQPLQRIVQGGPSQAGWSQAQVNAYNTQAIQRGAATARDLSAVIGGGPGGMGGKEVVDLGNGNTGVTNKLAMAEKAEAQTSAAESAGTIANYNAGREEFNNAVGEEKQLPSVFSTANQGGSVAGEVNKEAQVSQQNIDTEKRGASFSGVLSKGLSGVGGSILGGLSPASAGSKLAAQQMIPGMPGKSAADAGLDAGEATADTGTLTPPTSGGPMTGDN